MKPASSKRPRRRAQRLEIIARIIGEEHRRPRPQAREQFDLIVLQRQRFQAAGELDAPVLPAQHGEHRLDVVARTGQQIVVEDVPAVDDRQQPGNRIALPD